LIRLLGALFPNILAGTMVGNPLRIRPPPATFADELRNALLLTVFFCFFITILFYDKE
jgi:hypothetical protein